MAGDIRHSRAVPEDDTSDGRRGASKLAPPTRTSRLLRWAVAFLGLWILAGTGDTTVSRRIYVATQTELGREDFAAACQSARNGYQGWQSSPASEWHWRFRLQLAECLNGLE